MRSETCAKRPKGVPDKYSKVNMSDKFRSSQPRRCRGEGGSSGKSDNAGKPPRVERGSTALRRRRIGKGLTVSGG